MKLTITFDVDTEKDQELYEMILGCSRAEVLKQYYVDNEIEPEDERDLEPAELSLVHYAFALKWNRSVSVAKVLDVVN